MESVPNTNRVIVESFGGQYGTDDPEHSFEIVNNFDDATPTASSEGTLNHEVVCVQQSLGDTFKTPALPASLDATHVSSFLQDPTVEEVPITLEEYPEPTSVFSDPSSRNIESTVSTPNESLDDIVNIRIQLEKLKHDMDAYTSSDNPSQLFLEVELKKHIQELLEEVEMLRKEKKTALDDAKRLSDDLLEQNSKVQDLRQIQEESEQKISALHQEKEAHRNKNASHSSEIERMQDENEALSGANQALKTETERVLLDLAAIAHDKGELQESNKQLIEEKARIRLEVDLLKKEAEEFYKERELNKQIQQENITVIAELKVKLTDMDKQLESVNSENKTLTEQMAQAKTTVQTELANTARAEKETDALMKENAKLTKAMEKAKAELDNKFKMQELKHSEALDAKQIQVTQLGEKNEKLGLDLTRLRNKNNQLVAALDKERTDAAKAKVDLRKIQETVRERTDDAGQGSEDFIQQLTQALDDRDLRIEVLTQQLRMLELQVAGIPPE